MERIKENAVKIIVSTILAAAGFGISAAFMFSLNAPNYGVGIVMGVTLVCYLYGLPAAIYAFVISMSATYYWLVEPSGSWQMANYADAMRILTLFITLIVTVAIVMLLRAAEHRAQTKNRQLELTSKELRETQSQLVDALQHERHIASNLQKAFLPTIPQRVGDFILAATYEAGSTEAEIGGDFYDVFTHCNGKFSLAIGDASGKGLQAARQAIAAKYGLRFCSAECGHPSECLKSLNSLLTQDPDFSGFVTLFYGILDTENRILTYCTGGHEPPIIYRNKTGEIQRLKPTGRFVGILPGDEGFSEETIRLHEGDNLFMFTDGFTEAAGTDGLLGWRGLANMLSIHAEMITPDKLKKMVNAAREYAGGAFRDDAAAILLCVD